VIAVTAISSLLWQSPGHSKPGELALLCRGVTGGLGVAAPGGQGRRVIAIIRAYRTALDPTTEQRKQLARQAGATRWVYNWALARWREQYERTKTGGERPSAYGIQKQLTSLKKTQEFSWLQEVSAYVVREAVDDVRQAHKHFWRRLKEGQRGRGAGEPRFRSAKDHSGRRFRVAQPDAIDVREDRVKIAGVGWVRLHERGYIPTGANSRALACREIGGRWYVAIQIEEERSERPNPRQTERVGIEVGVRVLAQTSDGDSFGAVRDLQGLRRADRRRKLWERRMVRRYRKGLSSREQSAGWHEAARQVSRLHAQGADLRRDKLHQTTTRLVRKARGATLVLRDMQVARMIGRAGKVGPETRATKAFAPMVARVGMYELRRQIEYKQRWRGGSVAIAPCELPSSRTCNACGAVREGRPSYPSWTCRACGSILDRELNSARNLRDFAESSSPGGSGGQAGHRKTARKAAQRPAEPDQSVAEAELTPPSIPDRGGAVQAALASLGSGNRADGEKSSSEKRGLTPHATGRAASARHRSTSISILQQRAGPAADQPPTGWRRRKSPGPVPDDRE
jgi:putative transposase